MPCAAREKIALRITDELLQSQQAQNLLDALRNTAGVSTSQTSQNVYNNLAIRGVAGFIAVGRDGNRFTNEAAAYHAFTIGMFEAGAIPAFLIADAAAVKTYGMGVILPGACAFFIETGHQFTQMIKADEFFSFASTIILASGLVFETPILIFFLARLGIVTPAFLLQKSKWAIVLSFILAAILSPFIGAAQAAPVKFDIPAQPYP